MMGSRRVRRRNSVEEERCEGFRNEDEEREGGEEDGEEEAVCDGSGSRRRPRGERRDKRVSQLDEDGDVGVGIEQDGEVQEGTA